MTQAQLTADMMIGKHVEIRDEITAKKKEYETWEKDQKARLAKIETWVKDRLSRYDSDHFHSADGDCFIDPSTDRVIIGEAKPEAFSDWVIHQYLETRDEEIKALEKATETEVKALKELQAKRETWLMTQMNTVGTTTLKCADKAFAFKTYKDSATVGDRDQYLTWVHENWEDRQSFLDSRVNKTAVKEKLEAWSARSEELKAKKVDQQEIDRILTEEFGAPVPPGVNYSKVECVQVRRK